jgi:hypothetical protein
VIGKYRGHIRTFFTREEKPKLGNEGAITLKAGLPSSPLVRGGIILVASMKLPGPKDW